MSCCSNGLELKRQLPGGNRAPEIEVARAIAEIFAAPERLHSHMLEGATPGPAAQPLSRPLPTTVRVNCRDRCGVGHGIRQSVQQIDSALEEVKLTY